MRSGAPRIFGHGYSVGRELQRDSFFERRKWLQWSDRRAFREHELRKPRGRNRRERLG
jgi:hypothetical protein